MRSQLAPTKKKHTRQFFLRRAVRRYNWLRLVARKVSRTALRTRRVTRSINRHLKSACNVSHKQLLFLRAAVRARTKSYKTARKMSQLHARQKSQYYRRSRRLGRRQLIAFKWGKKHYRRRRTCRKDHRESRRMRSMQRSRGRA
jgi:hypothetical protein